MKPCSVVVKNLLVTAGEGVFATSIFIAGEPTSPDNAITLYDNSGEGNLPLVSRTGKRTSIHRVQIRVRNTNYQTAYDTAFDIGKILRYTEPFTLAKEGDDPYAIRYTSFVETGSVLFLLKDKKQRSIFVLNMKITREEV